MNRQLLAYRLIFLVEVFILRTHYPSGRTWANILCVHLGYTSLALRRARETHYASGRTTFRSASFKTYFDGKFVQTRNVSCARLYT